MASDETVDSIAFRDTIAPLTPREKQMFLNRVWLEQDAESHDRMLYAMLLAVQPHQTSPINKMYARIIKDIKEQAIQDTSLKLNNLSRDCGGLIASFLQVRSYVDFSLACRKLFVDCNRPNQLRQLNLQHVKHYETMRLSRFQHLNHLTFYLRDINRFSQAVEDIFDGVCNLKTLVIVGHQSNQDHIRKLMGIKSKHFAELESLSLVRVGIHGRLHVHNLMYLLGKFPNLKHLKLFHTHIFLRNGADKLKSQLQKLGKLHHIDFIGDHKIGSYLDTLFPRLDTISIGCNNDGINFDFLQLSQISRVCFNATTTSIIKYDIRTLFAH